MNDKKKYKYLTKVQKVAGMEVTLYSIDGAVWSSRQDELVEILERHERERSSFGGEIKGQVTGGKSPFRGGRPAGRPRREHYVPEGASAESRPSFDMDEDGAPDEGVPMDDDMRLEADSAIDVDADLDDERLDDRDLDEDLSGHSDDEEAPPLKKRGRPAKAAVAAKAAPVKSVPDKAKKAKTAPVVAQPSKKQAPAKKQPVAKKAAGQKASKTALPKAKPRAAQGKSAKKPVAKSKAKKKAA